jgi:c(7)-type cytochrome triheme protein
MRKSFLPGLMALLLSTGTALAVSPGTVLEFKGGPMGKVIFDGKVHKDAGAVCKECHNDELFPKMKQGTVKITMEEIYAGRLCGVCHNGKRAFAPAGNCARCHIKP